MAVEITDSAAARLRELASGGNGYPRVEITAGGCNGFDKRFSMDTARDDDLLIAIGNGVYLLVDPMSNELLSNSRIDFKNGLSGSHFTIEIPEATSTCGCGSSFSL